MNLTGIPQEIKENIRRGVAIPAMPLALSPRRRLSERYQRALTRYYIDAGAGGIAVAVHSTQFEIRDPDIGLFKPVLELVSEAADRWCSKRDRTIAMIAGVCGGTDQAMREASTARALGYHACLLSLAAMKNAKDDELIAHCRRVAGIMPLVGFYLQPAVGGRALSLEFWRKFAEIGNVLAIKIAPFDRYRTLDVVRAVCEAGRENDIALYTGNDDHIVGDLITPFRIPTARGETTVRIVGGLLGHWSVWTKKAVELLDEIQALRGSETLPARLLTLGAEITDSNAALFDPGNNYAGCLSGINEVLFRQGLLESPLCLDADQRLSPGQSAEIDRVGRCYPHLTDDDFVRRHLDEWLR